MDDKEFFDRLYQMWAKTSWAKDRYWDYEHDPLTGYCVGAVSEDGYRAHVAAFQREEDADWVTALHGCFPDLFRFIIDALDEAERADFDKDSRECRIAELEVQVEELRDAVDTLRGGEHG